MYENFFPPLYSTFQFNFCLPKCACSSKECLVMTFAWCSLTSPLILLNYKNSKKVCPDKNTEYRLKKMVDENQSGPDQERWSHIQTLCTACPTLAHCHSGPVSLWQPQPLTQDLDCLKEKKTPIPECLSDGCIPIISTSPLCILNCGHCFQWNTSLLSSVAYNACGH